MPWIIAYDYAAARRVIRLPATLIGIQFLRRLVFDAGDKIGIVDVRYAATIVGLNVDHSTFNYPAGF